MLSLRRAAFLTLVLCALASSAVAQTVYDPATAPRVVSAEGSRDGGAGLDDRITLTVRNFDKLLEQTNGNCGAITLFINGLPLKALPAESCNAYDGKVRYLLDRNDDNDDIWHDLLGSPDGFGRRVSISLGANGQFSVPTDVHSFHLHVIPGPQFYIFLGLLAVSLVVFVAMCRRTSLIRAPLSPPGGGSRPFSLSRFQMAFWFFLVIASYVFMWLITGELDTITDSVLALIGIGAGTALGAALIDSAPQKLTDAGAPAAADPTPPPPPPPARPSQGFMHDVLDDGGGGISIHRFQMFAWTLILGVIFVSSVYKNLSMPEFNATLLGLMGISSGTYLGFKFPEKKNQEATAAGAS